ncbi:MAG: hypothetical protein K0Q59_2997, partial [Paenibacillus sp.]|nr:hypothetical protein [Paenibacillus sp.]
LWEKLGFTPDEYATVTTDLNMKEWKEPEQFHSKRIEPAVELDFNAIKQILMDDGEEGMAELFQNQYSTTIQPDRVVLTLKDKATDQIAGIAYYRVTTYRKDASTKSLQVIGFGMHIRPQFQVHHKEIRRFVQGCLLSMKQLQVNNVITHLILKNFAVFAAMVAEGFHNRGLEKANTLRMYKSV